MKWDLELSDYNIRFEQGPLKGKSVKDFIAELTLLASSREASEHRWTMILDTSSSK